MQKNIAYLLKQAMTNLKGGPCGSAESDKMAVIRVNKKIKHGENWA